MVGEEILKLREEGKSYREIEKTLGVSRSTISYHCKKWGLTNIGLNNGNPAICFKDEIKEYYKTHTQKETSEFFNVSKSSITRYKDNKNIKISNSTERKKRKYTYVSNFRQRLKIKAVEYKGGKCSICGYDKCNRSLDFHHRDPNEKEFEIGSSKVLNWTKIKLELDKCDILCGNCHGELHEKLDREKLDREHKKE